MDEPDSNGGYGDSHSLSLKYPVPTLTIARPTAGPYKGEDVIGVHKMVNGQLIFEAPYGAIADEKELRLIQQNLDSEQRLFYKR